MSYFKILLVPILLSAFVIAGCDNDSNSSAQEPAPAPADCPCFDMSDVIGLSDNAVGISCENQVWQLNLIADSEDIKQLIAGCSEMGTDCSCLGPGSGDNFMDISVDEAGRCFHFLLNGLIQFGPDLVVSGECSFVPPN